MLALALSVALAAAPSASVDNPCRDSQTTAAAIECFSAARDDADKALAVLVARLRALMTDAADRDALERAQAAWRADRDATCDQLVDRFWDGGTIRVPAVLDCEGRLARSRRHDLEAFFSVPLNH